MQVYKQSLAGIETQLDRRVEPVTSTLIRERLIGISLWADQARSAVASHAAHDNAVVLEGPAGAGKKFLARLIHNSSARFEQPFVAFSCRQVSPLSIESALFGSVRGSNLIQTGLVQALGAGTLYINGVSSFTSALKAKIARLIEYREFSPASSDVIEYADIRVIIGSSEPAEPVLEQSDSEMLRIAIRDKLVIPPLYKRAADIEPLSNNFVGEFCRQLKKEPREISDETIAHLTRHDWPGNVSELKRVLYQMIQRSKPAPLDAALLPTHIVRASGSKRSICGSGIDLTSEVEQFEVALLSEALKQCHGVQNKAAQLLNIKPTTLNMKLLRYRINVSQFK
jgi:DNA-binding NtrC family response regulator